MICTKCLVDKTEDEFRGTRKQCRECERAAGRLYRRTTTKAKEWVESNKERMSDLQHDWYVENKAKIRENYNSRYHNDAAFKESKQHKSALICFIKGTGKTSIHVNCDAARLRDWLSYQFDDNMTFANHGNYWSVDHVIPVDKFLQDELSSEIILNWQNVRPVVSSLNLRRNKHATSEELEIHYNTLKRYAKTQKLVLDSNYTTAIKNMQTLLRNTSKLGPLKASDTTSIEKSVEGSGLMDHPDGNNSEDITIANQQCDSLSPLWSG